MAYSTIPKTRRDGSITLIDGTSPVVELLIAYEDGNLTINTPNTFTSTVIRDRGDTTTVRKGDDQQLSGTFSFHLRQFTEATVTGGSIIDFLTKAGGYSSNISTGSAGVPYVEQYCIDIKYIALGSTVGDPVDSQVVLSKCIIDSYDFTEGDPDSVSISFTVYGGSTITSA